MDLRQLRYFVGIVQAGSLSRAADQLHVAQSAISHHLASLESELDRQLVTRGPKGILLTEAGGVLYRHAEAILRQVEFAKHDALSAQNVPSGRVSIGFPVALASLLGYELLVRIRKSYPQILLHLTDANSALLRERLVNGRLDMAVLLIEQPERGLAVEPLVLEELFYVSADGDNSPIRLADAAKFPLLVPGPAAASSAPPWKRSTNKVCRDADRRMRHHEYVAPAGCIRHRQFDHDMVAVHDGDPQIALNHRNFADAKLERTVSLCFSEVGLRSPATEAVALTLKSLVREMIESGAWQGVTLIAPEAEPSDAPARNGELNRTAPGGRAASGRPLMKKKNEK